MHGAPGRHTTGQPALAVVARQRTAGWEVPVAPHCCVPQATALYKDVMKALKEIEHVWSCSNHNVRGRGGGGRWSC